MKTVSIVIRQSPFNRASASETLRMSVGLLLADNKVRIIFMEQGIYLLGRLHPEKINGPDIPRHLRTLNDFSCEIIAEEEALTSRGPLNIIKDAVVKSRGVIAQLLVESDFVITA